MSKKTLFVVVFLLFCTISGFSQVEIAREELFQIPVEIQSSLIGMRSSGDKVVVASANGRYVRYDLETGEKLTGKMPANLILDFDMVLGQPVYLDDSGRVMGKIRPSWPIKNYEAVRLETSNEGLMLFGGDKAWFLDKNATESVEIADAVFVLPINNGFFYSMKIRAKQRLWGIDLHDSYGNLMKEVYTFSSEFSPTGVEIGPKGPESEILVSAYEHNERKLSLIANNGHMFWKINGPEKLCVRDVAFDKQGNLLVLERKNSQIWLNRWKFTVPEG